MKLKRKWLFLLILILFPINAFADSTITVGCKQNEIGLSDYVTCDVTGSSTANISSISMKVSPTEYFEMTFSAGGNFNFEAGDKFKRDGIIETYSLNDSTGDNFKIGSLTIHPKEGITVGKKSIILTDVVFYVANSSEEINAVSYGSPITVIDDSANQKQNGLKELKIEGSTFDFNPDNHTPTANISASTKTFKIDVTPINSSDQIVISNFSTDEEIPFPYNVTFKPGASTSDGEGDVMTIIINVGSCGDECKYTLSVTRPKDTSASNDHVLSSLKVCGKTIDLSTGELVDNVSNLYSYKYSVALSLDDCKNGTKFEAELIDKDKYKFNDNEIIPLDGDKGKAVITHSADYFKKDGPKSIIVKPMEGVKEIHYIIEGKIESSGEGDMEPESPTTPSENPQTGSFPIFVVFILLLGSLIYGLVTYKKYLTSE